MLNALGAKGPGYRIPSDYRARQVTLLFGFLALASVLWHQQAPLAHWVLPVLFCLGWPYLARELAEQALSPKAAQRRNVLVDLFMGGVMVAIMRFDMLPSMLAILLGGLNAWRHGGWQLAARGLLLQGSGVLLSVLSYGFMWSPHSSLLTILLCAPLIMLHPLLIGRSLDKVVARLRRQRREHERRLRHDPESGLFVRRYWESRAQSALSRCRQGDAASLICLAFDPVAGSGEDVALQPRDMLFPALGECLQRVLREGDIVGRLDDSTVGVVLPGASQAQARLAVLRIRQAVQDTPQLQALGVTLCFGVAGYRIEWLALADWVRQASQALFRARQVGRDCMAVAGETAVESVGRAADLEALHARQPQLMEKLFEGLEQSGCGLGLFDPDDRLVLSNALFREWFSVQADTKTFADMMRYCFHHECGPALGSTQDIDAWLQVVDHMRRSEFCRHFMVDMVDGGCLSALETSFGDGWVLLVLNRADVTESRDA
ncbi:MASE2 domain-containing protein [Corticimicrobacter populi]|uniref:diguanylate cyclase n=1 Tax=Corticimicrobacter populi TaxID=2175229 RepID=A0A2V1JWY5_9BURK|nr:MASE2 domain-containing protein [Corticimicrobacter populi]PWF21743.1 hypothetical protein DD235_13125 [Corticimicrobacter populi]